MKHRQGAREQFRAKFQITNVNLEEGTFEGMASVFGSMVDTWPPTIVERGAFTKTLQEQAGRIKVLWQHDPYCPIGKPTLLEETETGLRMVSKISDTDMGADALTLIRDGVVDELSIGFDPIRWEMVQDPAMPNDSNAMIRHLKELRLWEVSVVTWAADPMAMISGVHSRTPAPADYVWDEAQARERVAAWAKFTAGDQLVEAAVHAAGGESLSPRQAAMRYGSAFLMHNVPEVARRRQGALEFKHLVCDVVDGELRLVPSALLGAAVALTRESLADKKPMPTGMPKMLMDAVAVMKALLDADTPPEPDPKAPVVKQDTRPAIEPAPAANTDVMLRLMEMEHNALMAGVR